VVDVVQVASLIGILLIIVVSFESLVHTRRGAVRESLEQLDPIRLATRRDIKVKPILYRCRGIVVVGTCEVKFKFYGAEMPGASDPSVFVEFPDHVFGGHAVRTEPDGYVVTIDTNDPVELRREANEIMLAMYEYDTDADGPPVGE